MSHGTHEEHRLRYVDQGTALDGAADTDIDLEPRDLLPDIGADERVFE